jgi:hypothetical protein
VGIYRLVRTIIALAGVVVLFGSLNVSAAGAATLQDVQYAVPADGGPTPTPTPTPTSTPPGGPHVVFVHGRASNAADIGFDPATGTCKSGYQALICGMGRGTGATITVFTFYQDLAYRQGDGTCSPGMPAPDTNIGLLPAVPGSINPAICDSQSDLAYNAAMLDDLLATISDPVQLVSDSLGAPIVRGWLALAQQRGNTRTVQAVIFHHGAQEGVYLLNILNSVKASLGPISDFLVQKLLSIGGFDPTRPAIQQVTPQSAWYRTVNAAPIPQNLHYYNFFTDIKIHLTQWCLFWQCGDLGTQDLGDTIILPGDPNPAATPPDGGARFLPGGQQTADRHEFSTSQTIEAVVSGGNDPTGPLLAAAGQAFNSPLAHTNAGDHVGDGQIMVDSCIGGGQVTVLAKINFILENPDRGCS